MRPDNGTAQVGLPARSHSGSAGTERIGGAMAAVAMIGTLVGMAGVGHAMYDALTRDGAASWAAGLEAVVAALFLEGVVMTCAKRARAQAADSKAARLDVAVVLVAAVVSGLVSGIHAGLGTTAGLFRFAVPIIAAAVWLGDVVTVLRRHRSTDHERTLRAVLAAVGRHAEATVSGRPGRLRRADVALVRAMSAYAAADGDRGELARRLNEMHHRADLLTPLGPSPWPLALTGQPGHGDQVLTTDRDTVTKAVTGLLTTDRPFDQRDQSGDRLFDQRDQSADQRDQADRLFDQADQLVTAPVTSRLPKAVVSAPAQHEPTSQQTTPRAPVSRANAGAATTESVGEAVGSRLVGGRSGDTQSRPVTARIDHRPGHADQPVTAVSSGDSGGGRLVTMTSAQTAVLTSDHGCDHNRDQADRLFDQRDQSADRLFDQSGWADQSTGHGDQSGPGVDQRPVSESALLLHGEPVEVRRLVTELAAGRELTATSAAALLGVSQSTGGRRLRRARALLEQAHVPDRGSQAVHLSLVQPS